MATFDDLRAPSLSAGIAGRIGYAIIDFVQALMLWNEKNHTRAQLSALSDHQLEDIGLTRGDVDFL